MSCQTTELSRAVMLIFHGGAGVGVEERHFGWGANKKLREKSTQFFFSYTHDGICVGPTYQLGNIWASKSDRA